MGHIAIEHVGEWAALCLWVVLYRIESTVVFLSPLCHSSHVSISLAFLSLPSVVPIYRVLSNSFNIFGKLLLFKKHPAKL